MKDNLFLRWWIQFQTNLKFFPINCRSVVRVRVWNAKVFHFCRRTIVVLVPSDNDFIITARRQNCPITDQFSADKKPLPVTDQLRDVTMARHAPERAREIPRRIQLSAKINALMSSIWLPFFWSHFKFTCLPIYMPGWSLICEPPAYHSAARFHWVCSKDSGDQNIIEDSRPRSPSLKRATHGMWQTAWGASLSTRPGDTYLSASCPPVIWKFMDLRYFSLESGNELWLAFVR